MLNAIKKIQSRLKYNNVIKTRQEIREIYTALLGENENPTEEEIKSVIDKLSNNHEIVTVDVVTTEIQKNKSSQLVESENKVMLQPEEIPAPGLTTSTSTSSALTFDDSFSKALAVKNDIANSALTLNDFQVFEIATSIPDTYKSDLEFTQTILNCIHEKYDLESLRTKLIVEESLDQLMYKQQQSRQDTKTKLKLTLDLMANNSKAYREADMRLLEVLKAGFNGK